LSDAVLSNLDFLQRNFDVEGALAVGSS